MHNDTLKSTEHTVAGAVLAGGRASRYGGTAKGLLECAAGVSIIEKLIGEMTSAGINEIVILANDPEPYRFCRREIVPDLTSGIGPLGGIEAGLAHYAEWRDAVVFLPCDLPGITACEISVLKAAFCASDAGIVVAESADSFWQPLCTVVRTALLSDISKAIEKGERRVQQVWKDLGASAVRFDDPAAFFNVNTPDDMRRWQARDRGAT